MIGSVFVASSRALNLESTAEVRQPSKTAFKTSLSRQRPSRRRSVGDHPECQWTLRAHDYSVAAADICGQSSSSGRSLRPCQYGIIKQIIVHLPAISHPDVSSAQVVASAKRRSKTTSVCVSRRLNRVIDLGRPGNAADVPGSSSWPSRQLGPSHCAPLDSVDDSLTSVCTRPLRQSGLLLPFDSQRPRQPIRRIGAGSMSEMKTITCRRAMGVVSIVSRGIYRSRQRKW